MTIPTEPIGSIPRPPDLLAAMAGHERGEVSDLRRLRLRAIRRRYLHLA